MNTKIGVSERNIGDIGTGGNGDTSIYQPDKCLISDQYGSVTVSHVSSHELRHLTGLRIFKHI